MALPISYNIRNLLVRWRVSLLAIGGVALVVGVFVVLTAMASGFRIALRSTGRTDNAIVVRKGSTSEIISEISRENAAVIMLDPRVARDSDGRPLASPEILTFLNLPRKLDRVLVNVAVRGVAPAAFKVRGGVRLVTGRLFRPGLLEVVVGRRTRDRFGLNIDMPLKIRKSNWNVVGIFESEGSSFESEVWADLQTLAEPIRRTQDYQSIVLRLTDPGSLQELTSALESNPGWQVEVKQERRYYEDQSGSVTASLMGLTLFVSIIMGVGAVFAAMNTMYAIVSARTCEIGTLRAMGFSRSAVLISFITESILLSGVGGLLGCLLALPINTITSATNSVNFAELAFAFHTTPLALSIGLIFAMIMGVFGGLLPALRAARLPITSALREI